jgi:hypothetical protein
VAGKDDTTKPGQIPQDSEFDIFITILFGCWQNVHIARNHPNVSLTKVRETKGCQTFLDTMYQNIPNYHNIIKWS